MWRFESSRAHLGFCVFEGFGFLLVPQKSRKIQVRIGLCSVALLLLTFLLVVQNGLI